MRSIHLALVLALSLTLAACEEAVTQENFDQIQTGMSLAEIELFMGEGHLEEATGTSLGIGGLPERSSDDVRDRTYSWEEDGKIITVKIVDDKVTSKRKVGWK